MSVLSSVFEMACRPGRSLAGAPFRRGMIRSLTVAGLAGLVLAGCSSDGKDGKDGKDDKPREEKKAKKENMNCPEIRLDRDTAKVVVFREQGGRDITDTMFEAEIIDYSGDCGWNQETRTLDVKMKVLFAVTRGPAMPDPVGHFTYYVAIPAFYPEPAAKQTLAVDFTFPAKGNVSSMKVRDGEVNVRIPMAEGKKAGDVPVYVGFQLTPDQLEYNRRQRR